MDDHYCDMAIDTHLSHYRIADVTGSLEEYQWEIQTMRIDNPRLDAIQGDVQLFETKQRGDRYASTSLPLFRISLAHFDLIWTGEVWEYSNAENMLLLGPIKMPYWLIFWPWK